MKAYGFNMSGTLIFEKVTTRPEWTDDDTGRCIYVTSTGNYWLGGDEYSDGDCGWILLGIGNQSIKKYHIDWDTYLVDDGEKVSASDIPVSYEDTTSNVQSAISAMYQLIADTQSGVELMDGVVKLRHLDVISSERVHADGIPITNNDGNFSGTSPTIEDALNELSSRSASTMVLDDEGTFGSLLGLAASDTQSALEALETYLSELSATEMVCEYEGCTGDCTNYTVQNAINALYALAGDNTLGDLTDGPGEYDADNLYIRSNGSDGWEWVTPIANDISCEYTPAGDSNVNVQGALWAINSQFINIQSQIDNFTIAAADVIYSHAGHTSNFNNVDDALDYMFTKFFYDEEDHYQSAAKTPCNAIIESTNTDVQSALSAIETSLNTLYGMIDCNVEASNVSYAGYTGASDVDTALDHLIECILDIYDKIGETPLYSFTD